MSAMLRFGFIVLVLVCGCSRPAPKTLRLVLDPEPCDAPGLHNVYRVAPDVYSGSSPVEPRSFESLQRLGVKTIISVDGAVPDGKAAKSFGMRYVHLPIGYDGMTESRTVEIAKAIRDLPGPVYIHCHHGKHRGPAAIVGALRCLKPSIDEQSLANFLKMAGTDPKYTGLLALANREPPPLDESQIEFREVAEIPDLVRRMVELDEVWDRLKKEPTAKDTTLLVEAYREMKRAVKERDERFQHYLDEAQLAADELESAFRAGRKTVDAIRKSAAVCTACHAVYRDHRVSSPP